jgi:anion-transporting  ArsA/GET3 family ATPase
VRFLRAPQATTELVNLGPIHSQAQQVVDLLRDRERTHINLVTVLEEMPVVETVEAASALRELGVTVGPLVVNRVLPERFDEQGRKALREDLSPDELAAMLGDEGLFGDADLAAAEALRALGTAHLERLALQERMRDELERSLSMPTLELPYVYGAEFGSDALAVLAAAIEEAME